jgi:hypothetical protein
MKLIKFAQNVMNEIKGRYRSFQEVYQPGYSFSYRWYRLREAFWYWPEEPKEKVEVHCLCTDDIKALNKPSWHRITCPLYKARK